MKMTETVKRLNIGYFIRVINVVPIIQSPLKVLYNLPYYSDHPCRDRKDK